MPMMKSSAPNPEAGTATAEARELLEQAINHLPESYRTVVVLREVEEMSVAETAECLEISQENVKVRLHRARNLLRKRLYGLFGSKVSDMFRFHLSRCDRVVRGVFGLPALTRLKGLQLSRLL